MCYNEYMEENFAESARRMSVDAKNTKNNVKHAGMLKLTVLYCVTLGILYGAFWCGYYWIEGWWGIGLAVFMVAATSVLLALFTKKSWSAIVSCLSVSAGIGLSVSTFYVVLEVEPSRFFGLVLLAVLLYKSLQNFFMAGLKHKKLITFLVIALEVLLAVIFFARMASNKGLNSQIGFACVTAIFLSFGQLTLYKCGANDMWRTIALSYVIGFVFIVVFIVLLIISILAEDGSALELLEAFSFGDVGSSGGGKQKKRLPRS